ncbi:hypothetical protein HPB47_026920 [Ixodes persulcatus]|uniref:Uncharacterized protein n=1 Tax=Ixodes persulcatus TaxID=34615 RepID=A0AC60PXE0_IXOPE|nr:hypothetical protein HPB47_026920 [Ixodes persulcatus]
MQRSPPQLSSSWSTSRGSTSLLPAVGHWDTLAIVLPVPLYRMESVPLCAAGLFKRVRRFPVPASTKDFFVRLHLEVLPVKVWLDARGFFVPWSTNCDLCGSSETIQHVFVECSNAYLFWDELRVAFGQDFEIDWITFKYLHLGGSDSSDVAPAIVLLGLQAIWLARTAMVECHTDARPTWDYFTSRLRWLLSIAAGEEHHEGREWQHIRDRLEAKQLRDQRARQRRDRGGANWGSHAFLPARG